MDVYRCTIAPGVWFGSKRIHIGNASSVNYGCMFNTTSKISIGNNCDIGMQVLFVTSTHEIGPSEKRGGKAISRPIIIGNGVWIGARSVILPGAMIGHGAVIAAGSIVSGNIPDNMLFGGVPAKEIRKLQ
ncbi:acyltransferase [Rhodococcus sp. D-46]|nr:acyltransferase [Rhodococcus sp. D-46]